MHLSLSLNKRSTPQENNNDDDSNDSVAKSFWVLRYVITIQHYMASSFNAPSYHLAWIWLYRTLLALYFKFSESHLSLSLANATVPSPAQFHTDVTWQYLSSVPHFLPQSSAHAQHGLFWEKSKCVIGMDIIKS